MTWHVWSLLHCVPGIFISPVSKLPGNSDRNMEYIPSPAFFHFMNTILYSYFFDLWCKCVGFEKNVGGLMVVPGYYFNTRIAQVNLSCVVIGRLNFSKTRLSNFLKGTCIGFWIKCSIRAAKSHKKSLIAPKRFQGIEYHLKSRMWNIRPIVVEIDILICP